MSFWINTLLAAFNVLLIILFIGAAIVHARENRRLNRPRQYDRAPDTIEEARRRRR